VSNPENIYKERTAWPIWLWIFLLFLAGSLALAFWAALGNRWGAITALLQVLGLLYLSQRTPLTIEVTESELKVGQAHIARKFLGQAHALSADEMRRWRGPLSDPAGFMALRFWVGAGVKIEVKDSMDPTPYWLISSKKAQPLVDALFERE
jgi:hypothetical protein